jgi:nitrogen regulatory protein PII
MQAVKRIEIITDAREMREVRAAIERLGITGYSIVREVIGQGDRGTQSGDDLSGVSSNSLLITTCAPGQIDELIGLIRPLLRERGGVCLVSDAQWVVH